MPIVRRRSGCLTVYCQNCSEAFDGGEHGGPIHQLLRHQRLVHERVPIVQESIPPKRYSITTADVIDEWTRENGKRISIWDLMELAGASGFAFDSLRNRAQSMGVSVVQRY